MRFISFDERTGFFHLSTGGSSYIFQLLPHGHLAHIYWGKNLREATMGLAARIPARAFAPGAGVSDSCPALDTLAQEYPGYGSGDFRAPAFEVQMQNGSTVTDLRYAGHRLISGKLPLEGLPATYVEHDEEAETLEVDLADALTGLRATLSYTVFPRFDAVVRSVRFFNGGNENLSLRRALSVGVDFCASEYDFLHLSGAWARERHIHRAPLRSGIQSVESRRGASSHAHNPFVALLASGATETHGEIYGFSLVYSGNFLAQAEVDAYGGTRVTLGINPFDFGWLLVPGEAFQTPEAVLVYSDQGLGGMSRNYHRLYRTRLCRGRWRDRERPIRINNWEVTYFDFNQGRIEEIARVGKGLGIELFVLDDGWFGKRDDDRSSLGDWTADRRKLEGGLEKLGERITGTGMRFGLWFEPEMVSRDSDLYRQHPDWCLHVPGRARTESRNQLMLDLTRSEVCDFIVESVAAVLSAAPVSYVKWDMNRNMTEIGSGSLSPERQRETAHRYILGLYRVLEEITRRFPDVLFESCSGGGGRFDPGMLYYMPQTWTSDNTDAVSRLKIQYGTSLVYPLSTAGAHVSAVPNHQVDRITSLELRGAVAMSGNLGYELDLGTLTATELEVVRRQVALYKEVRLLVQQGDLYRLKDPFAGDRNEAAWMIVAPDQAEAVVFYFRLLGEANPRFVCGLRLHGLDEAREYRVLESGEVIAGDVLLNVGLKVPEIRGDFTFAMWRLQDAGLAGITAQSGPIF